MQNETNLIYKLKHKPADMVCRITEVETSDDGIHGGTDNTELNVYNSVRKSDHQKM